MTAPWPHGQALATGQVFEFRLWAALVEQSRGQLHVFLPLADRGIDALVHRLSDGQYFRVQAKSRTSLRDGEVQIMVPAFGLMDDEALLIGGLVVEGGLGPTMLVVPVREFKRLAGKDADYGRLVYEMSFPTRPGSDSRWVPYLVPLENLSASFGVSAAAEPQLEQELEELQPLLRSDLGFTGESEVVRLCPKSPTSICSGRFLTSRPLSWPPFIDATAGCLDCKSKPSRSTAHTRENLCTLRRQASAPVPARISWCSLGFVIRIASMRNVCSSPPRTCRPLSSRDCRTVISGSVGTRAPANKSDWIHIGVHGRLSSHASRRSFLALSQRLQFTAFASSGCRSRPTGRSAKSGRPDVR